MKSESDEPGGLGDDWNSVLEGDYELFHCTPVSEGSVVEGEVGGSRSLVRSRPFPNQPCEARSVDR